MSEERCDICGKGGDLFVDYNGYYVHLGQCTKTNSKLMELQSERDTYKQALINIGMSCLNCKDNKMCKYAWDAYNIGGECLANK
jgi:hypothetical protein